jgi:hypothetical protein
LRFRDFEIYDRYFYGNGPFAGSRPLIPSNSKSSIQISKSLNQLSNDYFCGLVLKNMAKAKKSGKSKSSRKASVKSSKPVILITNDDCITAPRTRNLAEAVRDLGKVLVVALTSRNPEWVMPSPSGVRYDCMP